jgi:large subunit ribosomal protein L3
MEKLQMGVGLVGRKCGMTRIFTPDGASIPVTVIQVVRNQITQVKTIETDGYGSVQVSSGNKKASKVNKSMTGHYAKASVEAGSSLDEFRVNADSSLSLGDELSVTSFEEGQKVDVTGVTKGKGFAGGVKRHHFSMQDATHGNSISHRAPGSIGQCQTPGRVFKGKKMAGHLGNAQRTTQNLLVVRVDEGKGLLFIKGAVPGPISGKIVINQAVKG